MVAQIMFFALGFLVAALIALIILPAFNARAKRLARQRIEALLPVSTTEIAAGQDLIRAENAVAENRKDQVIARKNETIHRQMLELSRNRSDIEALQASLANLQKELEAARAHTAEHNQQVAEGVEQSTIAAQNEVLSRRIEELADKIMELGKQEHGSS